MPIDLTRPLAWTKASTDEQKMLQSLQGNILKSHGRTGTINVFFTIDPARSAEMRRALREIANFHATSALKQLEETERFQKTGESGDPFVAVMLSARGYVALGKAAASPNAQIFRNGMKAPSSLGQLGDPPIAEWEPPFQNDIDGMLLVGDDEPNRLRVECDHLVAILEAAGGTIVHRQKGGALRNEVGEGIEHFGYVDGRSQPLMLAEEIEREASGGGTSQWDPEFPLDTALVADPGMNDGVSFGSFFIFRKLEQDVRGFKRREQELADALGFAGEARELAGALAVGRFEDGTPVTLSDEALGRVPDNDFTYKADPGTRCPFHAHIRKVNPRGTGNAEPEPDERLHLMPRRGIPFEDVPRATHPSTLPESDSLADFDADVAPLLPTGGVGLLFMAYNRALEEQFAFTQSIWANNPGFPLNVAPPPGVDPVIGIGTANQSWPLSWDDPAAGTVQFSFDGFVKMRGGEYFFAPSLSFLKSL